MQVLGAYGVASGRDLNKHDKKAATGSRIDLWVSKNMLYYKVHKHAVRLCGSLSLRNRYTLGLVGAKASGFSSTGKIAHGCAMVFAWVFLCPTAVFDARAGKGLLGPLWFQLHRGMQVVAVLLTIAGAVLIFMDESVKITADSPIASQRHRKIGTAVIALSIFQLLLGFARNLISQKRSSDAKDVNFPNGRRRWLFKYMHWGTGLLLVVLAYLNVFSGLWLGCSDSNRSPDCERGIGWVSAPVKDFFYIAVVFPAISYLAVAGFQLVSAPSRSGSATNNLVSHALALVTAVSLSASITIMTMIADTASS